MRKIVKCCEPGHFQRWKQRFLADNGCNALYDDLRNTAEYGRLKSSLLEEQGYICCYCERAIGRSSLSDSDIEHFMPRHPDRRVLTQEECERCRNAQMDYTNLFASCLGEDAYSADHCNHKIFAISSNRKGEELKKHLNLDSYVLNEQRKAAYDAVMEIEFESDELLDDAQYIMDTIHFYRQMDEQGDFTPFCSMITYCMKHELLD